MKKILLMIAIIFCIFQMIVLATAIDIGNEAIDRPDKMPFGYTRIDANNSANASGTITSVEIYVATNTYTNDVEIAIFYRPDPDNFPLNFSTRDSVNLGPLGTGYDQFNVNLSVEAEDYIGAYWGSSYGYIDYTKSGAGNWDKSGDQIPCTNATFALGANRTLSIKGTGATEEEEANAIFFGINF